MIQISGLWLNKSKDGKTTYMVGYMGNAKILIFKNQYKDSDKKPDYILYVDEKQMEETEEIPENDVPF